MGIGWLEFYSTDFQSLNVSLVDIIMEFSQVYCKVYKYFYLQGAIFLVIQYFLSATINKGFELFEIFDLNKRHAINRMDIGLYVMDNLKSTLL
jgi:hypothetical protein